MCGSMEGQQEDRLSGLPDNLLHSILHGLSLKDAVCTSGISRQWTTWVRALATSPVLDFTDRAFVRQAPAQVVALVSLYLKRHADQGAPLDVLRVSLDGTRGGAKAFERDVVGWVADAVARGAKEVEVDLTPKRGDGAAAQQHDSTESFFVELPGDLLLARNSLVRLALDRFSLRAVLPRAPAGFAGLRSLSLSHANVTDDEVKAALSSCLLLEFLSLRSCHLLKSLSIVGHKLRGLELVTCLGIHKLQVTAPALESFAFHGEIVCVGHDYRSDSAVYFDDTPALRDAYLSHIGFGNIYDGEHRFGYSDFLDCVACAKSLTLCSVGLKHLWMQAQVRCYENLPLDFDVENVQELQVLMVSLDDYDLKAVAEFLQHNAFSSLDRLFIRLPGEQVEASDVVDALDGELDIRFLTDKFVHHHLRLLKVVNFHGTGCELAWLAFLLEGTPTLEELVLVTVEEEHGASGHILQKLIQLRPTEMTKARVTVCRPSEDCSQNPAHTRLYHME